MGRTHPIELAKGAAVLIGGIVLLAFVFSGGGMAFGSILLIGCFVVPPAVLAMVLMLLIVRWIGQRLRIPAGWTLALSFPMGFASGVGGFYFGTYALSKVWDYLPRTMAK
ncbi:MAG: hypothetical protein ABSD74_20265 [Rhizomicrobium sp.]|jgi:hypothetical protein